MVYWDWAHFPRKDEAVLHVPVEYHSHDTAHGLVEDDVVPHQVKHLELVGNVNRLLDDATLCNRQANQTTASTNLESVGMSLHQYATSKTAYDMSLVRSM